MLICVEQLVFRVHCEVQLPMQHPNSAKQVPEVPYSKTMVSDRGHCSQKEVVDGAQRAAPEVEILS